MFNLTNLIDFCKYVLILNLMPVTCFKQVGTEATNSHITSFVNEFTN